MQLLAVTAALFAASSVSAAAGVCGINNYMIIVLENEDATSVIADSYFGALAKQGYYMSNYNGVNHPSEPNYLAMISGSYQGISSDGNFNFNAKTVVDLLETKGLTWKAYQEAYPGNCYTGTSSGTYYRKHNPFISFTPISGNSARCAKIVTSTQLATDAAANNLPNYMFYTPDINNDGHDTGISYASSWLQGFLTPKLTDPAYANTLFHIVFDESATTSPNNIC